MDIQSKEAIELLEVLAATNTKINDLAQHLRTHPDVLRVLHALECREFLTGSTVEGYVDVELRNGKSVCWFMEVGWSNDAWIIDTRILVNDACGQETAHHFPERIIDKCNVFLEQLIESIDELTKFDGLALGI
jgi:hypothetical protein